MSWKINLGNYGDIAVGCIFNNVANLLLCIESTIRLAIILARIVTYNCLGTLGANSSKQRILLYLYAPTLVVCKMPVESVDVVQSQNIDECTNRVGRNKVSRYIEMSATIGKSRSVCNVDSRNLNLCCLAANYRQRLA